MLHRLMGAQLAFMLVIVSDYANTKADVNKALNVPCSPEY
jgi:hypothetical protein